MAGEFTWDREAPATLLDIDLSVPRGALVAIVGQTGSGKSSLLSAALGLMQQVQGPDVLVRGKVRVNILLFGYSENSCVAPHSDLNCTFLAIVCNCTSSDVLAFWTCILSCLHNLRDVRVHIFCTQSE